MKLSTSNRILIWSGLGLVLLIGADLLAPHGLPGLLDIVGDDAYRLLTRPFFHLGKLPVTPLFLIQALVLLLVLSLVSRMSRRFMQNRILRHAALDPGQQYALAHVTGDLVFLFGLMVALQSAGADLSSFLVLGGALGIGTGFGLQPIVGNFVSGLVLLVERSIKVGDRVEIGNTLGDVVRIAGRSTWVRTGQAPTTPVH